MHRPSPTPLISDAVLTAHLPGEAVLLDMEGRKYFRLNETAAAIWKQLEKGASRAALLEHLCSQFDVAPKVAKRELNRLLGELETRNLIRSPTNEGAAAE